MTVNKGLKTLSENTPDFSNQSLENAINELKIGWVAKSIQLDTDIENNIILTASQKNDLKDTINNIGYLNAGKFLGDLVRHSNTIIDGSILPVADGLEDEPQGNFLEILQLTQTIQDTIPEVFGVTPEEQSRSINDHVGTLNNIFSQSEDSTQPVFTSLKESITFINNASLATETALGTAIDNLSAFLNEVVGDSTDFQQTLNGFGTAVATANTNFDTALQAQPYAIKRTQMIADRDSVNTQVSLENTNLVGIRTYVETLTDNLAYSALAEDTGMRQVLINTSQNANFKQYFENYDLNEEYRNPLFDTDDDDEKESRIDTVLASRGLPDVTDFYDLASVANKALLDTRIDTKGFDGFSNEKIIETCVTQLGLDEYGDIFVKSERLLNNLNRRDRDIIKEQLDQNRDANTIS